MSDQSWVPPGSDPTRPPESSAPGTPAAPPPTPPSPPAQAPWEGSPGPSGPAGPTTQGGYAGAPHPAYAPPGGPPSGPPTPPAQPQGWRPTFDFRPGIIPLRPLQIGDLFSGVFKAIRGNVAATVGLAALTSVIFLVPFTALGTWVASLDTTSLAPGSDDPFGPVNSSPLSIGSVASYIPSIASTFSTILLAGFLAYVIGQAVLGRKVTMGETWEGTKGRLLALVGATLVVSLITLVVLVIGVGIPVAIGVALVSSGTDPGAGMIVVLVLGGLVWLLALILAMLYFFTRLGFTTSAIVLERMGVGAAITRSWRLVGGLRERNFWRILGLRLLTSLVVGMASSIVTVPLVLIMMGVMFAVLSNGGDASQLFMAQTIMTGVAGLIGGALTTPFTAGIDALLYVDTRIRREGLDVTLMQAAQGSAPAPWPSAAAQGQ